MEKEAAIKDLNRLRKLNNVYKYLAIGFLVITILCMALSFGKIIPSVSFILPLVLSILFLVLKFMAEIKFRPVYKKELVEGVIKSIFQDASYEWEKGFDKEFIKNMYLFEHGDTYRTEDYLKAKYKNVNFEQAEVEIEKSYPGVNTSTVVTIFKGRMIVIDAPKQTEYIRVASKNLHCTYSLDERSVSPVETENVDFNNKFSIYAKNPQDAFYLLTPAMMVKMMQLLSENENIGVSWLGGKMNVAINTKRDAFDAKLSQKIDYEEEVKLIEQDLELIKRLIDIIYGE